MLIDDDEDDREIFKNAIDHINKVSCTYFDSAGDALKVLISGEIAPDVIFLDLNMPIMSGQQFLKAIKSIAGLNTIPVIIFSTSANPKNIREVRELGAHNYIVKPYTYGELIEILKSVL
jgi:CheY-like chemotaxis protein